MNSYFASVEQQANPLLRGRPVGVCEHLGGIIIAPSVEAKRMGIKLGTPVWEAVKIFPQIVLLHTDPDKYRDITQKFLQIFRDYSDNVEQYSIDEAFIDATEYCAGDYGEAMLLGLEIKQRIRLEVGEWVSCSVGIGPNKLISKIAADLDGGIFSPSPCPSPLPGPPKSVTAFGVGLRGEVGWGWNQIDRICVIRPEYVSQLYDYLNMTDVPGIGPRLKRALGKLGIFTLKELATYPLSNLLNQFGLWGQVLHDLANFQDTSAVMSEEEDAKSFGHAYTVGKALTSIDEIRRLMFKLSEKVGRRMRKYGVAGSVVHYFHSDKQYSSFSKQHKIKDFINDGKDIFRVAWSIFSPSLRVREGRGELRIKIMGVSVSGLKFSAQGRSASGGVQDFLFEQYERPRRLLSAMDKINDKYGDYTITRAEMHEAPDGWAKDTVGFGRTRHQKA
ncbi:MAG: hypothetical protein A2751_00430 [Candidatus Doudnabacteria bacterium RIFCSPHIGHO2_01_FULL_46_14]|uniref:UmuC domain-containing protein n=1 Tax=Candidatus Doudnabacteria bacterium RIFCSPHIGHO2_01_FULL_46_14 TaxID=1817824 RepID=A0A1F5NPE4_9BACT|nr:MAG: hypothetical protein A2751_00430 [Candidatus Doudnabacteria bacterium RIFCSPHIGHO2_01_FULL_46_14]